jgi:hypothetical protein
MGDPATFSIAFPPPLPGPHHAPYSISMITTTLLMMVLWVRQCCFFQARFLDKETTNLLIVIENTALYRKVYIMIIEEALNLLLEKLYPAVWQYHLASLPSKFYTEFCNGLPLEISITSYELQMQQQFTTACSWAILLNYGYGKPFLASITVQNMLLPRTFPHGNLCKWQLGRCSSL